VELDIGKNRIEAAVAMLTACRISCRNAIHGLRSMSGTIEVIELYRKWFPSEMPALLLKNVGRNSLERIRCRFLELVDRELFPIAVWGMVDDGQLEYGLPQLFIQPMQEDWWYENDHGSLPLLWIVFIALGNEMDVSGELTRRGIARDLVRPLFQNGPHSYGRGGEYNWGRLGELSDAQRGPLRGTILALQMFYHSVGNVWLDMSTEDCELDADWKDADLDWLSTAYREACQIDKDVSELNKWIETDHSRIKLLRDLLAKSFERKVRVRVGAGRPLVETLEEAGLLLE
jgi:hypothetical protein